MKTYELLDSPEKWTKGVCARDSRGKEIDPESPKAICWCIKGALYKCYPDDDDWYTAYNQLVKAKGYETWKYGGVVSWQDDPRTTYEEVIEVLKLADV
jgi:hypothetical protein